MKRNRRWVFEDRAFIAEMVTFGYDDLRSAIPLTEHAHAGCFEFVYMEKGRAAWEVGGRTYETVGGDVFTTFPDEVHKGNLDIIEPCRFWWIIIEADRGGKKAASAVADADMERVTGKVERQASAAVEKTMERRGEWFKLDSGEARALMNALVELPRVISIGPTAAEPFRRLQAALKRESELDRTEGRIAILDFLLMLVRRNTTSAADHRTMKRVAALIEQLPSRLDSAFSVPELAKEAGIGTTHFFKLFQEIAGLTPKAYIEHLRIEEASRRLRQSDDGIMAIAMDLGFATSQHFATVFRRIKGRTPTEWRNEGRE